ncbi:MAG TPA: hypothetical protein VGK73_38700 [Polyangiaceae bacterium]
MSNRTLLLVFLAYAALVAGIVEHCVPDLVNTPTPVPSSSGESFGKPARLGDG